MDVKNVILPKPHVAAFASADSRAFAAASSIDVATGARVELEGRELEGRPSLVVGTLPALIMAPYLHTVVLGVCPGYRCSVMGMRVLESMVMDVCERLLSATMTWQEGTRRLVDARMIHSAVRLVLPLPLASFAIGEGTKACYKFRHAAAQPRVDMDAAIAATHLRLPVPLIARFARYKGHVLSLEAAVFCTAATEYICAEVTELGGQTAKRRAAAADHPIIMKLITPDDIALGCHRDTELRKLFLSSGGTVPWLLPETQALLRASHTASAPHTEAEEMMEDTESEASADAVATSTPISAAEPGELVYFVNPCYGHGDALVRGLQGMASVSDWHEQVNGTSCSVPNAIYRVLASAVNAELDARDSTVLVADEAMLANSLGATAHLMIARDASEPAAAVSSRAELPAAHCVSLRDVQMQRESDSDDMDFELTWDIVADAAGGRRSAGMQELQRRIATILDEQAAFDLSRPPTLEFATAQLLDWPTLVLSSVVDALHALPVVAPDESGVDSRTHITAAAEELQRSLQDFRPQAGAALRSLLRADEPGRLVSVSWECVHLPLLPTFSPVWEEVLARIEAPLLRPCLRSPSPPDNAGSEAPLALDPTAFEALTREICQALPNRGLCFTPGALFALQTAAESMIMDRFAGAR